MLELARYIVLNPVRAGMVRSAKDWVRSSYRATTGLAAKPDFLATNWILAEFGHRKDTAVEHYKRFISGGKGQPSPWQALRNQMYLGSEPFVEKMQKLIDGEKDLSEIPTSQRRPVPKALGSYETGSTSLNEAILKAYPPSLKQLARLANVSVGYLEYRFPSLVRKVVEKSQSYQKRQQLNRRYQAQVAALRYFTDDRYADRTQSRKEAYRVLKEETGLPKWVLKNAIQTAYGALQVGG